MSKLANVLARLRLGRSIEDPMSGYFGVRSKLFQRVASDHEQKFEKQGYKVLFDFLKYAGRVRLTAVHYDFGERKRGKSKIGSKQIFGMIKALLK